MEYNFQADIGADIGDFMRGVKRVDAEIRDLATGVDVDFDADITDFSRGAMLIEAELDQLSRGDTQVQIDADTSPALRAMAFLRLQLAALSANNIKIKIQASWNNFRNIMGSIATFQRNIEEVTGTMGRGTLMFLSPAAVPVIASAAGVIGNLGPMIGTIAGSTFALGSAFGTAGIAAGGFGAIAVTNLKSIFGVNEELVKLQEKLAQADTTEERTELLAQMEKVQGSLNDEQQEGLKAIQDLKSTWSDIAGSFQPQTIEIFTQALGLLSDTLERLKPMFEGVMDVATGLMDSLSDSFDSAPMQAFFDYLNTSAAPILQIVTEAVGYFLQGFLNMMTAFGPLATETAEGFRKMGEGFAEWADGLSKSEKFQSFVDYVSENMPKIRSIFSDAIQGIINMFAAFAPSSQNMMDGLQDMMERFKEWSAALGESQGFRNFIDYIQTNGPVVLSVIGGLVDFIINLGKALAPTGEYMLDLVDRFLEWSNAMMEAHPWLGKVAGAAFVVAAGLVAIAPAVLLVNAMFGGLILGMIKVIAKMVWMVISWTAKWALMAAKALFHAARIAAAWLLTTGANMAVAVGKMIVTSAIFVAKWVWMGVQALLQAARMAAAWFIALGPVGWVIGIIVGLAILIIANWDKIADWTSKTWTKIWSWIKEKWASIKATTSEAVVSMLSTIATKFTEIVSNVREKMETAKSTIRDKWEEAKNTTREKLQALLSAAKELFAKVVTTIAEKMGEAVRKVAELVGKMPGEVTKFVGAMLSAGADLVSGLIDGIKNMGSSAISAITGVVDGVVSKAKSLLKIKSPSRVFREMGQYVSEGLAIGVDNNAGMAVKNVASMASAMTNAFNPQLAMADMNASANLDTSISRADMGVVRKSFAAEIPSVEVAERDIHLSVDGKKFAKFTAKPMQEEMDRNTAQRNVSQRGHN